ncbi:unnamed protein product [Ixodes hexagonus]
MASSNVIEVFIETLHGTAFELLVSPADTVVSIKSRISRLEGIPVSQQHLIWQSQELPDESSLHDCNVTDGATLKLVLGMRGGPINTRKATSAEERPSLFDVAKYLDAKQEELGLNAPRLRAVRMVVMRDGDQVHLYTLVDGGSRSSTGSLSSGHSTRELSDEDSATESRRHRENLVTRQKVELLQQKLKSCRLRKVGLKPEPEERTVPTPEPVSEPKPLLDTEPVLPEPYFRFSPDNPFNRNSQGKPGKVKSALLDSLVEIVPTDSRILFLFAAGEKVGRMLPQLLLSPSSGTSQKEASRLWRHRQRWDNFCRRCLSLLYTPLSLPRGSDMEARGAIGGALPKRLPEPGTTKMAARGAAGRAFRGRCRKVLIVTTSVGPSSPQCKGDGTEDGSGVDVGRFYKVLPPLGRQGCPCLPKERDLGAPERDLAPATLLEPPLELDTWDCQRPHTAPARFVRLSVLHSAMRPAAVSSPCSPEKGGESDGEAELSTDTLGDLSPSAKLAEHGPLSPRPLIHSPEAMGRSEYTLQRRLVRVMGERSSPGLTHRRQQPSPALGSRTGAEGIRWALAGGRTAASSSSSSRLAVIPLFRKVHSELLQASSELRRNLSRLGRLAADHEGEESRIPSGPKSNGPTENNPERQSTSAAGSSAGGPLSRALHKEGAKQRIVGFKRMKQEEEKDAKADSGVVPAAQAPQVVSSPSASSASAAAAAADECPKENSETGESSQDSSQSQLPPLKGKKKLGKRCSWCNRKTGLASTYVCRCGKNFCAAHRYAELHHCSHDYKTEGRHILQRNNPVVKASKLPKI